MANYKILCFESVAATVDATVEARRLHEEIKNDLQVYNVKTSTSIINTVKGDIKFITTISEIADKETHTLISECVRTSLALGCI